MNSHKQNEEQHIIRDIKGTDTCYCHTKDNEFICRFDLLSSNNTHYTGMKWSPLYNGYNGYNGGWPSARLFGWSAADWSRPATNMSISSERNRTSLLFCWERKSWTSWLLTCCSKKGWAAEKSSKKSVNRKEMCFLSSKTRWSWQIIQEKANIWEGWVQWLLLKRHVRQKWRWYKHFMRLKVNCQEKSNKGSFGGE